MGWAAAAYDADCARRQSDIPPHRRDRSAGIEESDRDKFMEALDAKWDGPLPHTMLIAPGGKVIYRHTGEIDPLELKKAIATSSWRPWMRNGMGRCRIRC